MAYYLSMNGTSDYLYTPSVTIDRVVMDVAIDGTSSNSNLYLFAPNGGSYVDASSMNTAFSYVQKSNMTIFRNSLTSMKINDGSNVSSAVLVSNQRYTIDYGFNAINDPATEFFTNVGRLASNTTKGKIYRITGYYLGAVVFDYNMSLGNVQDQSGNGKHATLIGGTWVTVPSTYYLSMDGVDDKISTPSMTVTEVILDVTLKTKGAFKKYWSIQGASDFFQVNGSNAENWSAGVSAVYKNGVAQTNSTNFMTVDTRATIRIVLTSAQTNINFIANNLGISGYLHCFVYNVKFYNGTTLVAHYDMATGTVEDQSNNGNHATLTGGTWVDTSGGSGTSGSIAYATKQVINSTSSAAYATKQAFNVSGSVAYATKQQLSQVGSAAYATKQRLNVVGSIACATQQTITSGGIPSSIVYATKQIISQVSSSPYASNQYIYQVGVTAYATKQTIATNGSFSAATKQTINNPNSVVIATNQRLFSTSSIAHLSRQNFYVTGLLSLATLQQIVDANNAILSRISISGSGSDDPQTAVISGGKRTIEIQGKNDPTKRVTIGGDL